MRYYLILTFILVYNSNSLGQSDKVNSKKSYLVTFHLTDRSTRSGIWISSSDSILQFTEHNEIVSLFPEQVYKFEIRKANSAKRNALIGAGVGFAIGFLIGFNEEDASLQPDHIRLGHASGAGLLGAFSGLLIGHLTGMIGKTHTVFGNLDQYRKILPDLQKYNQKQIP